MTTLNDTRRSDLFKTASALGRDEGEGRNARPKFGKALFLAAASAVVTTADAGKLYEQYAKAAASKVDIAARTDTDANSLKVQVSKANTFLKVGMLPFFLDAKEGQATAAQELFDRIETAIGALAMRAPESGKAAKNVPIYDKMVACMRAQLNKVKEGQAEPLTNVEIAEAIEPVKEKEGELDALERMRKQCYTMAKSWPDSAEAFIRAGDALTPRINILARESETKDALIAFNKLSPEVQAAALASLGAQN